MNNDRFDAMVRQLGTARSRRSALRIFAGAVVGTATTALLGTGTARAQVCPAGLTLCTNERNEPACRDVSSDGINCGGCSHTCHDDEKCTNGVCTCPGIVCPPDKICAAGVCMAPGVVPAG